MDAETYFPGRFSGQTIVITGGATGIGYAVADRIGKEGGHVALIDRDAATLATAAQQLKGDGIQVSTHVGDVTDEHAIAVIFDTVVSERGSVEAVVHGAAIVGPTAQKIVDIPVDDFRKVSEINLTGSYIMTQQALRVMQAKDYGRVLLIASIAGKEGNAGMVCYSSTKAAVIGMVKSVGKEFAETGITINALAPATIRTPMVEGMPDEQVKYMTDRIPMKRCGTLPEVAALIAWIVSKEASFNTGFTFDLTGGRAVY